MSLFRRKHVSAVLEKESGLKRCLGLSDLVAYGVNNMVGAGIFVVVGAAAGIVLTTWSELFLWNIREDLDTQILIWVPQSEKHNLKSRNEKITREPAVIGGMLV